MTDPDDDGGLQWWQTDGQFRADYEQYLDRLESKLNLELGDKDAQYQRNDWIRKVPQRG